MSIILTPKSLSGTVIAPPSKSMAHRLLICAGLANGKSVVKNIAPSDDILATIDALKTLGRTVGLQKNTCAISGKLSYGGSAIDCKESGSTLRFFIPILSALGGGVFTGADRLAERPLSVYKQVFAKQGLSFKQGFPLKIMGTLKGDVFEVKGDISSQFISGLMLAAPLMQQDTHIKITTKLESKGYVDMTIAAMQAFGVTVDIIEQDKEYLIKAKQPYCSRQNLEVEGDWSQSGFWILAGLASKTGIKIKGLSSTSTQGDIGIMAILETLGVKVQNNNGFISVKQTQIDGGTVDISQMPDLAPVVAGIMAVSGKPCTLTGCARLRIKESDRIASIVNTLNSLGSMATVVGDTIKIHGKLIGGIVKTYNDHRIAMMAAALSAFCSEPVYLDDETVVNKSYPAFWEDFAKLGGSYE